MEITYQYLWDNMIFGSLDVPERKGFKITESDIKATAGLILNNSLRYQEVVAGTNIPWQFIGVTHYRESSLNFKRHPHEGSPLSGRTLNIPKGRPKTGSPPFTWIESAHDCYITLKKLDKIEVWDIETILSELEKFNGLGYKKYHPEVLSPYLWSGTNYYIVGKYAFDGQFDSDLIDRQIGCAPLYKYLTDKTLDLIG